MKSKEISLDIVEALEDYNINDLRKLGREMNVQSPTTTFKQDLIQRIQETILASIKIDETTAKPDFSNVYRVNSDDVSVEERAEIVKETNKAIIPHGNICEGWFMPFTDENGVSLDGVLRKDKFNDEVENVFIAQSVIFKYDLRSGDFVTGKCIRLKRSNFFALFHAETINGENTADRIIRGGSKKQRKLREGNIVLEDMMLRPSFHNLKCVYPKEYIPLGTQTSLRALDVVTPIMAGSRALISVGVRVDVKDMFSALNNALCNLSKYKVVTLALNIRPEDKEFYQNNLKGDAHITTCDTEYDISARYAEVCMEIAKRDAELKKDTILLIDDISKLYNGSTFKVGYGKKFGVQRFFDSGRKLEQGGSITVIAFCRNSDISDHLTSSCTSRLDLIYERGKYDVNFQNSMITDSGDGLDFNQKAVISNLTGYALSRGNTLATNLLVSTPKDDLIKGFI